MNKDIKDYASLGGIARKAKCSSKVLSESGRKAITARWAKHNTKKNHVCEDLCICRCGRPKYRHASPEMKLEFLCEKMV